MCIEKHQVTNALRLRTREQAGNQRTTGMPQQVEAIPAKLVDHDTNIREVTPDVVFPVGAAMVAAAVTCQVQGDQVEFLQPPGKRPETLSIIQPAVQGKQGRLPGLTGAQGSEFAPVYLEYFFPHCLSYFPVRRWERIPLELRLSRTGVVHVEGNNTSRRKAWQGIV